ncbi:hypothetical protein [Zoogloea sp.]|uniref:hypothetical protein n=1 Tax=Zoogloea sp. TaxID=49181 RepID=UPI0035B2EDB5
MKSLLLKSPLRFALLSFFIGITSGANSASFDCQQARSTNERLICDDEELSRLDDELSAAYKSALRSTSDPKELIKNQRDAWKQREKECSSKQCLEDWFSDRKKYLSSTPPEAIPANTSKNSSAVKLATAEKALRENNNDTAFYLFKLLAEQGNAEAQANLGLMYERGTGVEIDYNEAFKWYLSASKQGAAWAQTNLGLAYLNGRGTEKSDTEATKWFRSAALKGNTSAQEIIGSLYNQGRGIPKGHQEVVKFINPSNLLYIAKLEKDYKKRIHFESPQAERIIRSRVIDCTAPQRNGHHLPLINLLYARLASIDREDMWLESNIQERNGEVRIVDHLRNKNEILNSKPVFQINKWGELQSLGSISIEALRNACFGSHGPIWLLE